MEWYEDRNGKNNSVKQIIGYLDEVNLATETEIQIDVFGYYRSDRRESNKKYADMLRRGLKSGKIKRYQEKVNNRMTFIYYIPGNGPDVTKTFVEWCKKK